jgi:predicted outer membrane protein
MRRAGLMGVTITATIIIVISGCSKTERTKPPSSEQPAAYSDAFGPGGAGANLRSDDDFVHDVAVKTMAPVELSRMALEKATDPNIRVFAQMMIDEHGAAGDELKSVVSGQGIEWPTQLDERRRRTLRFQRSKKSTCPQYSPSRYRRAALGVRTTRHSRLRRRLTENGELHLPRMRERMPQ